LVMVDTVGKVVDHGGTRWGLVKVGTTVGKVVGHGGTRWGLVKVGHGG
jgi:hypothetical protein